MNKAIEFYFDFVSPYSYLAHKRIHKIEKEKNIKFDYKPILLGGLHNLIGITAPAFINQKAKYLIKDCKMVAKKFNIKFTFNSMFPINSLNLLRGLLSINSNKKKIYIDNFYNAPPEELAAAIRDLNISSSFSLIPFGVSTKPTATLLNKFSGKDDALK